MLKLKSPICLFLFLVMVLSTITLSACESGATGATNYQKAIAIARGAIWQDINSGKASSATVAILDNGQIVYAEGFGMADREKSIPVDANTLFNIGSISKEFCTVGIMKLVDGGKVKLDYPVTTYLPEFTMLDPRYKDITVRMLLNHTSGLPTTNWVNGMGFEFDTEYHQKTLDVLSRSNLKYAPGESAAYCNDGFTLAEIIIERVSGQSFMDFLATNVLKPLSLNNTGLSIGQQKDKPIAAYYDPDTGKREPAEVVSILGAGGMASTADDLCRFAYMFSGDGKQVLSNSTLLQMRKPQPSAEKQAGLPGWPYGLGWDITELAPFQANGVQILGKGGNTGRYTGQILVAPDQKLSVAVVEAGASPPAITTASKIMESVLVEKGIMKASTAMVTKLPESQPIPQEYAAYEGYYAGSGFVTKIGLDFTQNILVSSVIYQGSEVSRPPTIYHDGFFYSSDSDKISLANVNGKYYIVTKSVFGDDIMAQRLTPPDKPISLMTDINGKIWLRRNISSFESRSTSLFNPFVISHTIPALPGYIDFDGIKEVKSSVYAGFAANYLRDQTELTLIDRDGQTWAMLSYKLMSPAEAAEPLLSGDKSMTLGSEGYNEWLTTKEDLILSFQKPAQSRVRIYSPALSSVYDSVIDTGEVLVSKGSYVELAGKPGDTFKITAR